MTIDEALDAVRGLDTRDLRESVRIRETLTALVAAAEERGRAEGVAACVGSARASLETLTRLLGRHNDAVLVMQACIDTWSAGRGLTDECAGALHRLLAAHGREAAREALRELLTTFRAWVAEENERRDTVGLMAFVACADEVSAALREASTTEGEGADG